MIDSFLTSPFISKFPDNLKETIFSGDSDYYDLYKAIKSGRLVAGMNGEAFVDLLSNLKEKEPELYKQFSSLEASAKLQATQSDLEIHDSLKKITIRKSILKEISQGYSQPVESVFHDEVGDSKKKLEIIKAGGKPLIDDQDLNSGLVSYLFNEKSIPLNRGEGFNWSRFLSDYIYPFSHIRILDPYLYINVKDIDLNNMLKTLVRQSDPEKMTIEIVSDLEADSGRKPDEVLDKVYQELEKVGDIKKIVQLYS